MTELHDLYVKKQEIKDRRRVFLRALQKANTELGGITDELLAVDLEIRLLEEKQNGTAKTSSPSRAR